MSTFSTLSTLIAALRVHLKEASANKWTDATLTTYLNEAHRELLAQAAEIEGSGYGTDTETFTVAASGETYDLSGLTEANGTFQSIFKLWHVPTGLAPVPMRVMSEEMVERYRLDDGGTVSPQTTPGYALRFEGQTQNLYILPPASDTRTFKIQYVYEASELTSGQQLHLPRQFDRLIRLMAWERALDDLGLENDKLPARIQAEELKFFHFIGRNADKARGSEIGSGAMDSLWSVEANY